MGMTEREQDAFLAGQLAMTAPPAPEPVYIEDNPPTALDLDEHLGPTLVTICADTSGDDWHGPNGRIECWDVEAAVNSPQFSEVA
jgi:hypothetical protein